MDRVQEPPPETEAPPYPGPSINPVGQSIPFQPAPAFPGPPINVVSQSIPFQHAPAFHGLPGNTVCQVVPSQHGNFATFVTMEKPTDLPGRMLCPYCQNVVLTEIEHKDGALSAMLGSMCCLCTWRRSYADSLKDVHHSCPNCHKVIHIHKQLQAQQQRQYH